MNMAYPWHFYLMAILYIVAGSLHFIKPGMYLRILPAYLPSHKFLVAFSGIVEIMLGMALFIGGTRNYAIYAIIIMLVFFLPVHFHMLQNKKAAMGLPKWALIARIPLQLALMFRRMVIFVFRCKKPRRK